MVKIRKLRNNYLSIKRTSRFEVSSRTGLLRPLTTLTQVQKARKVAKRGRGEGEAKCLTIAKSTFCQYIKKLQMRE